MTDTNLDIAATILQQMSGIRNLTMMTGAKDFIAIDNGVQFRMGRGATGGINRVRVTLDLGSDTYNVAFFAGAGANVRQVGENYAGIYADMIRDLFERTTGFYLAFLPTRPRV
jgi:hypothetical protein